MYKYKVEDLRSGMVLAEDVLTPGGRFVMPKGTVLEVGHLKALQAWDLAAVSVDGESPAAAPGDRQSAEAEVRRRFALVDTEVGVGQVLFRLAMAREPTGSTMPAAATPAAATELPAAPSAEALLHDEPQLVSPPEVYRRVNRVLRDPSSTSEDAAEAIRHDPSLAAKLLRLVNSPFYTRTMRAVSGRFPTKVDSLSRAVLVVGARQLSTLALGVSVLPLFQDIPQQWVNMRLFWKHCVACAVAAQTIAEAVGRDNVEAAFVAGLMHDLGRIVLFKQAPRHMAAALRLALDARLPLIRAEQQILGFDHALLGGMLLRKWQIPANLEAMVRGHHEPEAWDGEADVAVIHLADIVANALAWGGSGCQYLPPLDEPLWQRLGLTDRLEGLIPEMEASLGETMRNFFPDHEESS